MTGPARSAERAARTSYGRLLALLAVRTGDLADAEDALADAFERALTRWPVDGVPANPDAWLMTVARNRLRDLWKSAGRRHATEWPADLEPPAPIATDPAAGVGTIEDRRLELLLVCAHPAIDETIHTPLMLNTVLGCTAADIATAFALPPATLAARLVRAKRRIRQTRIPFRIPDASALPTRLDAVLQAVYGAYAIDWSTGTRERIGLAGEASHLADTAAELTDDPEALGLAAMINFSGARLAARRAPDGRYVPLEDQDPTDWDGELILRARAQLRRAHELQLNRGRVALGRFQLEAAIQAVHCARWDRPDADPDTSILVRLHGALAELAPGLGTATALAAAIGEHAGPAAGLDHLDRYVVVLPGASRFQPAWATRAHLLARAGAMADAVAAVSTAIDLTHEAGERAHLMAQRERWSARS